MEGRYSRQSMPMFCLSPASLLSQAGIWSACLLLDDNVEALPSVAQGAGTSIARYAVWHAMTLTVRPGM